MMRAAQFLFSAVVLTVPVWMLPWARAEASTVVLFAGLLSLLCALIARRRRDGLGTAGEGGLSCLEAWRCLWPWALFVGIGLFSLLLSISVDPAAADYGGGGWWRWIPAVADVEAARARWNLLGGSLACAAAAVLGTLDRCGVRALWWLFAGNGAAVAGAGVYFKVTGAREVLGLLPAENQSFFGPFGYHNHYVAFALMVILVLVGLLLSLRIPGAVSRRVVAAVLAVLIILVLVSFGLVRSRSSWLLLIPVSGVIMLSFRHRLIGSAHAACRSPLRRGLFFGLVLVVMAGVAGGLYLGRGQVKERWKDTRAQFELLLQGKAPDLRFYAAREAGRMFLLRPLWGWGAGSYPTVFPLVAGPEFLDDAYQSETKYYGTLIRMRNAHQDWMQLLAESGAVGAFLFLGGGFLLIRRARRDRALDLFPSFVLGGAVAVALVACWDSPLQNPAVFPVFVFAVASLLRLNAPEMAPPPGGARDLSAVPVHG